jgi:hypothetical protein
MGLGVGGHVGRHHRNAETALARGSRLELQAKKSHANKPRVGVTLRGAANSIDRMAGTLLDAQVDLNPHQIDAALFATSNPLSKGAILADEVGLGKTIEAGLLIAQKWAERKRQILIIVPANLRKQWHQELADKFGLPGQILETKSFKQSLKDGAANPFESKRVIICSYQFAAGKADSLKAVVWDLVVIDEAHRLRNVYKPENKTARTLRDALIHGRKVLLTATPLQNSLLELYGLVSFIDERVFGDLDSYRVQFGQLKDTSTFAALKQRISPICKRTLRRQVEAYVKYTKRIPLLREFVPGPDEARLYDLVSGYLRRQGLYALPNSQRQLITLVLRKLLASSTFAIAGALDSLIRRLKKTLEQKSPPASEVMDALFDACRVGPEIGRRRGTVWVMRSGIAAQPSRRSRMSREGYMRTVTVLAAIMASCFIGVAHADKVSIGGSHSSSEIKGACGAAGGDYWEVGSSYGCVNECPNSNGGLGVCGVSCTDGKCEGTTPDRTITGSPRALQGLLKGKVEAVEAKPVTQGKPESR